MLIISASQESSDASEDEVDACISVDHITPLETWEENWLFQRKKIATQPEPVAMLVPNPSEDYRALIGDKDADDMSDLSEFSAQSDEEVDEDLIEAINQAVPQSPKVGRLAPGSSADDSANLNVNFTSEIARENSNDVEVPSIRVHGLRIESDIVKEEKEANVGKINGTEIETREGEDYRENTAENADITEGRHNITTPITNSRFENDPVVPITCEVQKLSEKLIADDSNDIVDQNYSKLEKPVETTQEEQLIPEILQNGNTLNGKTTPDDETLNNTSYVFV